MEGCDSRRSCAGERKSKRSRRGRCALSVSSSTQLSQLKLHVAQSLDIHPRNSAVHACQGGSWRLLDGDDKTLRGPSFFQYLTSCPPNACHLSESWICFVPWLPPLFQDTPDMPYCSMRANTCSPLKLLPQHQDAHSLRAKRFNVTMQKQLPFCSEHGKCDC